METVAPIAKPTSMTVSICMTWEPTDTAVVAATGANCPMMKRSASPYSVCRRYDKRYGSENRTTPRTTLPSV